VLGAPGARRRVVDRGEREWEGVEADLRGVDDSIDRPVQRGKEQSTELNQ